MITYLLPHTRTNFFLKKKLDIKDNVPIETMNANLLFCRVILSMEPMQAYKVFDYLKRHVFATSYLKFFSDLLYLYIHVVSYLYLVPYLAF